jgi:hypothetical protein
MLLLLVQAPTVMSSMAFCTSFKYRPPTAIQECQRCKILIFKSREIRLFLVFLNPCSSPLPVFQPSLPDKTSEYTCIALEAVLEVPALSFYNRNQFTTNNCQTPLTSLQALPSSASAPHIPALITRFHALLDPASQANQTESFF